MSWIDITIIALIVLCGLFGMLRGFKKSVLSVGAFLIAFVLAFFLANVVAEALLSIDGVKNFVLGSGVGEEAGWSLAQMIYAARMDPDAVLPGEGTFLYENFYMPIFEIVSSANVEVDLNAGIAIYYAFLIFSSICGVGIFLVARILLVIVTVIIGSFIGKKKTWLSRLFGFGVGAARGAIWSLALLLVFSCYGGLTFIPAVNSIENECEPPTAVLTQHFNSGAYYIRNNLFLPGADMYGRVVNLVYQKETDENPDLEPLPRKRLELFINLKNLNYENQPWSIDANNRRTYDEDNAQTVDASTYAALGFDGVMEAIMNYNTSAATIVENTENLSDVSDETYDNYNGFIQTNSTCVYTLMNTLKTNLNRYLKHYQDGLEYTNDELIAAQNITLQNDYNDVCATLNDMINQYDYVKDLLGAFPDISQLIPEVRKAGPQSA